MDHQPKAPDFIKSLGEFFKRDLISIPLIKKHPHQQVTQRCGLKAATLELDTTSFPNIEYIAGNRLSVYPVNPAEHVNAVIKHLVDDITPLALAQQQQQQQQNVARKPPTSGTGHPSAAKNKRPSVADLKQQQHPAATLGVKMSDPWAKFAQVNGRDSLKLALAYLYDITTAPSRELLRVMAECCSNREHKSKLLAVCKTDESWEKWVCAGLRTLKSTMDEFSSCQMSAKSLFSELHLQQPRQYSISSIKSSRRFRTEIIVFQHKFANKEIANSLQMIKERERIQQQDTNTSSGPTHHPPTTVHVNHNDEPRSSRSVRSLRSMVAYGTSPITSQQVKRVPSYSGALMSSYALSSINNQAAANDPLSAIKSRQSAGSSGSRTIKSHQSKVDNAPPSQQQYEGLCSNYLLNLSSNDYIVCEFVENPRFTLKGNRERPIMMIGQDVGVVAFRPFWQQRAVEHDRAQVFYTLFKDLSPKKFGDMQLVCLTGSKCKIEDLFKREISYVVRQKILSSATYLNKSHLIGLLDSAAASSSGPTTVAINTENNNDISPSGTGNKLKEQQQLPKDLLELGNRMAKLLTEFNGCIYTCCDAQMTQALEILAVESIARSNSQLPRDRIMSLLPKWKGRASGQATQSLTTAGTGTSSPAASNSNKFLFTLENPFERAQIVQEIYDSSI